MWVTACNMGENRTQTPSPEALTCCPLCSQRVSAGPGRRVHHPAVAAVATGAGVLPATSPTRPHLHRHCPLTASSPSGALHHLMMASTRQKPATCSSTSPFPGRERWVVHRVLHPRYQCLITHENEQPTPTLPHPHSMFCLNGL